MKNTSGTESKNKKYDKYSQVIRRFEGLFELLILMVFYYYTWKLFYRNEITRSFYGRGKFVLIGIYFVFLLVMFLLLECFQYGHMKLTDIIISQWISVIIVNVISYFQLCLILDYMRTFVPILVLTAIDMLVTGVLCYIYSVIYHNYRVPREMLLIYGTDNAVDLKFKMDRRRDKYRVTKVVNCNLPSDELFGIIDSYNAVILNDLPSVLRNDIVKHCYELRIRTYVVPKISDIIIGGSENITLFDTPLRLVRGEGLSFSQRLLKRTLDIVLCCIALIPGSIIMAGVALAIKIEDNGPVFYRQERITLNGRRFEILKFRSMIVDAEKAGESIPAEDNDPRITKVGKFIRSCRFDELPQLFNILRGDMSIVGPRPERVEHHEKYCKEIAEFNYRTKVKGGLTGYAQVYGKYNTSAYDKLRLDLMYIENYSLVLDIKLILTTVSTMLHKDSTEGFDRRRNLEDRRMDLLEDHKTDASH